MFATCLYCNVRFARNEILEHFPIGRRVAVDGARGRLWVVCDKCGRWNLSPLDERWETIEACERLYRATPIRASTDQIGLAKLREGLEIVRIGAPTRPEYAAWRYAREFARRRRRMMAYGGSMIAVAGTYYLTSFLAPSMLAGVPLVGLVPQLPQLATFYRQAIRPIAKVQLSNGKPYTLRAKDVADTKLELDDNGQSWRLNMLHGKGRSFARGAEAEQVLGRIITHVNVDGGKADLVESAVNQLLDAGSAQSFLMQHARNGSERTKSIGGLPVQTRLAIEMALHEDTERLALEGDLEALAAAWKDAEQIADIADRLLLPDWVNERVNRYRHDER